jgi:hypothetical protein
MLSILKITAALLLTALPAGAAMGQEFRQRSSNDSSFGNRQNDSSFGKQSDSGAGQSSFGSRDAGSRSSNQLQQPMAAPKSSGAFTSKPLPADLMILKSRSIFSRDHRAVAEASDRSNAAPVFTSAVEKLIFRGAMREGEGNHYVAFIEDSAGSRPPQLVSIGQLLTANGAQINDITLDYIVVEKSGTVRKIAVGDNLDSGTRLPSPPASASLNSGGASAAPAVPSNSATTSARPNNAAAPNAVTASATGTASDEDVAEMMKRRRVQELGQ